MNKTVAMDDAEQAGKASKPNPDRARLIELMQMVDTAKPRRSGFISWLWFILAVVVPIAATVFYLFSFASPKYTSSFRYVIQADSAVQASAPNGSIGSASASDSSELRITSFMLSDYISSPQMVTDLEQKHDLKVMFSSPDIDPIARLPEGASRDQLERYWKRRVSTDFDVTTGLTSVTVNAFDPRHAEQLANEMVVLIETLVNSLGNRAREDAVRLSEDIVRDAEQDITAAREALQKFRVSNLSVNPASEAGMTDSLLATLNQQYVEVTTQLSALRSQLAEESRLIKQLEQRAQSLNQAIEAARDQVSTSGALGGATREAFATQLRDFEDLQLDLKLATARYQSAVIAADKAREQANRQHVYILTYVLPDFAETPNSQDNIRLLFVVVVCAFAFWIMTSLVVAAIRDNG